jgi:hypothetical protein
MEVCQEQDQGFRSQDLEGDKAGFRSEESGRSRIKDSGARSQEEAGLRIQESGFRRRDCVV